MTLQNVYEITAAIFACLSLFVFLIRFNSPTICGLRWVGIAYASGAIGSALIGFRGTLPSFLTIPVATVLVMGVNVFLYRGFASLMKIRLKRVWPLYSVIVANLAITSYFYYVHDSVGARVLSTNICTATQYAFLAGILIRPGLQRTRMPRYTGALLYFFWIAVSIKSALTFTRQYGSLQQELVAPVTSVMPAAPILIAVSMGFFFLWLAMTHLQAELETQSHTDSLTGLMNRRGLEIAGTREFDVARRRKTNLSLILIDLDHFKAVNDRYGHERGDSALILLGACLRLYLRGVDYIARMGGEEFVILLPDTPESQALEVADRLRVKVLELRVPYERGFFQITASLGVSCLTESDQTWQDMLRRGDQAMYNAKRSGRNRVESGSLPIA